MIIIIKINSNNKHTQTHHYCVCLLLLFSVKSLMEFSSRMKDYYDIYYVAHGAATAE